MKCKNEYIQFRYYALGSLAEAMTRAIGLTQTKQISAALFHEFDLLYYEIENRLLRFIDKLEQKREDEDWIARIAEDPEEYITTPSLQHSATPTLITHA
jgi:translation initiation factor 2 alpha subunit (eIF-2alpha)